MALIFHINIKTIVKVKINSQEIEIGSIKIHRNCNYQL